jgi:hypothetical protein
MRNEWFTKLLVGYGIIGIGWNIYRAIAVFPKVPELAFYLGFPVWMFYAVYLLAMSALCGMSIGIGWAYFKVTKKEGK